MHKKDTFTIIASHFVREQLIIHIKNPPEKWSSCLRINLSISAEDRFNKSNIKRLVSKYNDGFSFLALQGLKRTKKLSTRKIVQQIIMR